MRVAGALIGLALVPASAAAEVRTEPVSTPSLRISLAGDGPRLIGAARPGPVRLTFSGEKAAAVHVLELHPGYSAAEVGRDLTSMERAGRLVAGATVTPGRTYRTTIIAHARDYLVVDADGGRATFTVAGHATFAPVPRPDALVKVRDGGFSAPAVLPRRGVIRVDNLARQARDATLLRIPHEISTRRAITIVRRGRSTGLPTPLVGLVSPGTTNRVQADLRPGRYLLVSLTRPVTYRPLRVR